VNDPRFASVLGRLLGPERPEVSCEVCFDELDRYVEDRRAGRDPELAVPGMTAHLAGCPACAEEYASLDALLGDDGGR
jgi:hypothetical protein